MLNRFDRQTRARLVGGISLVDRGFPEIAAPSIRSLRWDGDDKNYVVVFSVESKKTADVSLVLKMEEGRFVITLVDPPGI